MNRVVLLGASNVAIAFPSLVAGLTAGLPGPLSIYAAFGHGRSYCGWSRVLFRGLPGIEQCGLWESLASPVAEGSSRTFGLVTDVGNDLIYGSTPDVIAARLSTCLAALVAHRAEIVVTRLPLASVERLSPLRFHATKALFFPGTKLDWPTMIGRAREMDQRLAEVAVRFSARLIDQPGLWYGFDPIHIRRSCRSEAWRTIFAGWPSFDATASPRKPRQFEAIRLRLAPPAESRLFGRPSRSNQPALSLGDVAIRLY